MGVFMLGMDDMNELATTIRSASHILIILSETASDKDYLAALHLQKLAPEKTYLVAPAAKEREWNAAPAKKEFAITIDTTRTPVEELRYEKLGDALVIYLSHRNSFQKDAVSMQEHYPQADLVVTAGFRNIADAETAIDATHQKQGARHIWLDEYLGAVAENSTKLAQNSTALLGRLMVRSREDKDFGILWAFLTKEDFIKTQSSPTELPSLMRALSSITNIGKAAALFWQHAENPNTEGFLWSKDASLLDSIAKERELDRDDSLILALGSFANFIDAEVETRKLLRTFL